MVTKRKEHDDAPVRDPHPLFQQGSPPIDVERSHIAMFTVFRMNGPGPQVHVATIDRPNEIVTPSDLSRIVGGGRYHVKALANGAVSGRADRSTLTATSFEFDGPPNVVPSIPAIGQTAVSPAAPPPSVAQKAAEYGPAIVGMFGTVLTGFMQIMSEQRSARAAEEEKRFQREEAVRREREREAEERRLREQQLLEDRRERERREAEEARAERERREDERRREAEARAQQFAEAQRADQQRAAEREMLMMRTLIEKSTAPAKDGDVNSILLSHVLSQQKQPAPQEASAERVLDLAKKMKDLQGADETKMWTDIAIGAMTALGPTPVGQEVLARAASFVNLFPKPEQTQQQPVEPPVVITPVPQPEPEPPPAVVPQQMPVEAGPVTIN